MSASEADRIALVETGAAGVYLRSDAFGRVATAIERSFAALLGREPDMALRGGAVLPMGDLQRSAYVDRFPQLVATVSPHLHAEPAADATAMTPAACLSLYPIVAARGRIGARGLALSITSPCHRTETAYGPSRMRTFTMSELVFFGRPTQVAAFCDGLREGAGRWLRGLGLHPLEQAANDPFFGRGAELMAQHQRSLQTKVEIVLPIGPESEIACLSVNLHGEFFTQRWEIALEEGGWAQSACVGVGLERLTLALVERHGDRLEAWPPTVRDRLFGTP